MTDICGGGVSAARLGFGSFVSVGVGTIAATLNNVPTPLAVAAAGYIGLVGYELSTFCTVDPPPMPVLDAADWIALLSVAEPAAHALAIAKFEALLAATFWPTFCECLSTTTPAPPALPAPPSGLPVVDPPQLPSGTVSAPCWDFSGSVVVPSENQHVSLLQYIPNTGAHPVGPLATGEAGINVYPVPAGVTAYTHVFDVVISPPVNFGVDLNMYFYRADGTVLTTQSLGVYNSHPFGPFTSTIPTGAVYWAPVTSNDATNGPVTVSGELSFYCSGSPPNTLVTPCCPPDLSVQAQLDSIRALVESIYQSLPAQLNSYSDGAVHAGLTGNGTVTLSGSPLAVRVNITSDPLNLGVASGDPTYLFDRGYVVPIVNAAPVRGDVRLVYNPQMYLLPALTEQLGYSLHPGVVATITELNRGP